MLKKIKKLYDVIITLIVIIVVILAFFLVGVRLFGIKPFTVLSGSMEPKYHVGSVIYVKEISPEELSVGDPLTFVKNGSVITHEIVEIIDAENPRDMFFVTQGLTNNVNDGMIPVSNIIGKPIYTIPYLGYVAEYFQNPAGLICVVCVIFVLLVLSFILDIVTGYKKHDGSLTSQSSFSDSYTTPGENCDEDIKK